MFHAAALPQAMQLLQQHFLWPTGFLALLALLPLLIIYLMRPEPEEHVMPSMAFFMTERRTGTMQKALRKLQHNLVLLLHILFIAALAAALAGPYLQDGASAEKTVIVVDRSASMADDRDAMASFVRENAGATNTVVVVGEHVEVPMEEAPKRRAVQYVEGLDIRDVKTDLRAGLDVAQGYDGSIAVASDLDQTVGGGDAVSAVENLETSGRDVAVMDAAEDNQWGIVNLDVSHGNSTIGVKNLGDAEADIGVSAGDRGTTVTVPAGAVRTVTLRTETGKTAITLDDDPVPADNTAYVSIPPHRDFNVLLVSDEGNQYLEKAIELINFTTVRTVTPPLQDVPDADVYILGETDSVLRSTVHDIESRVRDGASMVVFAQDGIFSKAAALPVKRVGGREKASVEITEPRRVLVGETEVFDVTVTDGEALATRNALVSGKHGNGEVVLYNLDDDDFHFDFLYPVFWKDLLEQLTERPTVAERNLRTGERLTFSEITLPDGEVVDDETVMSDAGFYETSQGVYAANLLSPDESTEEEFGTGNGVLSGFSTADKPLEPFAVALLLVLGLGEFAYLRYRGSV